MNLNGPAMVAPGGIYTSSATPKAHLGEQFVTRDGRTFRYARAGAAPLVVGNVLQAPAQLTDHHSLTPVAAAVGATSISVAVGGTAATADQYAGGWAMIDVTPGLGYAYAIKSHPATAGSETIAIELESDTPIQVALTTSSRVTLVPNPYSAVIQSPVTTLTGAVVGVAVHPIPAGEYGFIQTGGPAGVLVAGTPGVGLAVVVPGTAAGCVVVDGAAAATKVVGSMMVTGEDGQVLPVFLDLE